MLRKWVGVAASVLALQSGAAMAQGALGANFNEHYEDVDYRELDRAGAKWIRLFLPMPQVDRGAAAHGAIRSEEHTSELKSLMRISYAVFCLKKKNKINNQNITKN